MMDNLDDQQGSPPEILNDDINNPETNNDNGISITEQEEATPPRRRRSPGSIITRSPHPWNSLPEDTMVNIMTYLDVRNLVEIKLVSRRFQNISTTAINSKGIGTTRKAFETNIELYDAVKRYCPLPEGTGDVAYEDEHINMTQQYCNRDVAEEIARTYGWPIGKWDVSNIEDFGSVFSCARGRNDQTRRWECWDLVKLFNEDISSWDVSNATSMYAMFSDAKKFNQDLSPWDVSNVTNMNGMFYSATNFNQDLFSWNVSNVTNMSGMFEDAEKFNGDISSWNVSNVTDMSQMFFSATSFNGNISGWDVSNVSLMDEIFRNAENFDQDLSSWDVGLAEYFFGYEEDCDFTPTMFEGSPMEGRWIYDEETRRWARNNE